VGVCVSSYTCVYVRMYVCIYVCMYGRMARRYLGKADEPGGELVAEVAREHVEVVGLALEVQLLAQDVQQVVLCVRVCVSDLRVSMCTRLIGPMARP
jgi:hypothetical protein